MILPKVFAVVKRSEPVVGITDSVELNDILIRLDGEIENASEFRKKLESPPYNYKFKSGSSSEVIGALIEVYLTMGHDLETSASLATVDMLGNFRFVVSYKTIPVVAGFTRGLPLYVLKNSTEVQVTSSISTYSEIYSMQDDEVVSVVYPDVIMMYDAKSLKLEPKPISFQTALISELIKSTK